MGNKVGGQVTQASETVRKRLTIRRRRPQDESDFSAIEIERKFLNIPTLTENEKNVLRSSWDVISKRVDQAGAVTFLGMFESNPETQNPFGDCPGIDLVQFEDSIFNGKRVMEIGINLTES